MAVFGNVDGGLKREADAVLASLVEPVAPGEPEFEYQPSGALRAQLAELEANERELNELRGYLSRAPEKPSKPSKPKGYTPSAELLKSIEERKSVERGLNAIRGMAFKSPMWQTPQSPAAKFPAGRVTWAKPLWKFSSFPDQFQVEINTRGTS